MQPPSNYEKDTLKAYRSESRAVEYRQHQTKAWSWARFVTWREQRAIARELARYDWSSSDRLLDIPCGTGILGKVLHRFPLRIVASDISPEMMALGKADYPPDRFAGCVQADITNTPFAHKSFACIIVLGFLHRVPSEKKREALREISLLSNRVVIVSCSVDTRVQRVKHAILTRIKRSHVPAPCPARLEQMIAECETNGLYAVKAFMVVPIFSAHAILVLERR